MKVANLPRITSLSLHSYNVYAVFPSIGHRIRNEFRSSFLIVVFMDPSTFEAGINECLKSCTITEMSSGPVPRWQKKLQGQSRGMPLSPLANGPGTPAVRTSCRTPGNAKSGSMTSKKTPGKICYIINFMGAQTKVIKTFWLIWCRIIPNLNSFNFPIKVRAKNLWCEKYFLLLTLNTLQFTQQIHDILKYFVLSLFLASFFITQWFALLYYFNWSRHLIPSFFQAKIHP